MIKQSDPPASGAAALVYMGQAGQRYHDQRGQARSSRTQRLRASLFADLVAPDRSVIDFGCGTGGVLKQLAARRRLGIEVNEGAMAEARAAGIEVFPSFDDLPAGVADVGISHHALEHVENPSEVLRSFLRALRPGATLRVVVPGESPFWRHQRHWDADGHQHLFTWTPRALGHLVALAGFTEVRARIAPPATRSRVVGLFARAAWCRDGLTWVRAAYRRDFNVIVDARKPVA